MAKATHMGTCQICGHLQKLPDGRLSRHGYTRRWGFFSGICTGFGYLPFEVSTDRIEQAIANAATRKETAVNESQEYKRGKQLDGNLAWVKVGSVWRQVEVICETKQLGGRSHYNTFYRRSGNTQQYLHELSGKQMTLEDARIYLNQLYASWHLDPMVRELGQYIKWQEERLKDWKPQELQPIPV